jgi:hypothetical protein
MSNKQHLSAWVSRETKGRFAQIARLQGRSESALLKFMVEAMLATATPPGDPTPVPEAAPSSRLSVRLRDDDLLMLRDRAQARGMPAATYVSFLVRSHLRRLAPLPDAEMHRVNSSSPAPASESDMGCQKLLPYSPKTFRNDASIWPPQ